MTTRRDLLSSALTAAGAALVSTPAPAEEPGHDHEHQDVPSDPALRVKALESLMVAKGLVDPAALALPRGNCGARTPHRGIA
jgi:hypothetical protein